MTKHRSCCIPFLRHIRQGGPLEGWRPWHFYRSRTVSGVSHFHLPFMNSKRLRSTICVPFLCLILTHLERGPRKAWPRVARTGTMYVLSKSTPRKTICDFFTCAYVVLHSSRTRIRLGKIYVLSVPCRTLCVVVLVSVRSIAVNLLILRLF